MLTPSRRAEDGRGIRGRVASAVRRVRRWMIASLGLPSDEWREVMDRRGDRWDGVKAVTDEELMIMAAAVIDWRSFIVADV